jgi:Fe-S-cluster containining protein
VTSSDTEVPPAPAPAPQKPAPEDVASALRFVHLVEAQTRARTQELAANLNALVETLVGEGQLPLEAYQKRRQLTVLRENERAQREVGLAVTDVKDKYALKQLPEIDCDARIPLCRGRCCALTFSLSVQDLDERIVRWNYGRPYLIAQREDGYCVHNDADRHCTVYENRPAVCRSYDCRNDRRIWIDFDKRIPAP